MKITFLTPGTGSYYCGACMRDNALARELHRAGHDVTIAPMYLPLTLDETMLDGLAQTPIFFGGINVFLQQKLSFFRKTPAFIDRLFNSRGLLRWAARHSHMTSAQVHGEMTLEMLNVETSRFRKEWDKLLDWLEQSAKPDLVCLSTALLAGFSAEMKRRLGAPVVLFFQGEDTFLDSLPEPYRAQCWATMSRHLAAADVLLAPSRFYAEFMRRRLGLVAGSIETVHNGIALDGYGVADAAPATPTIGYLARMSREKGLDVLVDAFIHLAGPMQDKTARLKIGGTATEADQPLITDLKERIARAGLTPRVEWAPNLSRDAKIAFLRSLTLFSVPTTYAEAFGLYVVEAMACGVPVVQPDAASFPEIIGTDGGGVCVPPRDRAALAEMWQHLLRHPAHCREMGRTGRMSVEKHFSARTMCEQFSRITARFSRPPA